MRTFIAALLMTTAAFAASAQATDAAGTADLAVAQRSALAPTTVGLHMGSRHSAPGYNDSNPGVYARWADASGSGWAAGAYYNSERANSVWAGYSYSLRASALPVSAAITLGAITGYKAAKVMPLIVPSVALHMGATTARLTYAPKVQKAGASAVHLSVEFAF